mgnify:CR=1 FL=1
MAPPPSAPQPLGPWILLQVMALNAKGIAACFLGTAQLSQQVKDETEEERKKGQAWGLKTIESFHTHGTPVVPLRHG